VNFKDQAKSHPRNQDRYDLKYFGPSGMTRTAQLHKKLRWRGAWLGALLAAMLPGLAGAQAPVRARRITAPVNDSNLMILRGNTHPLAQPRNDQGAVGDAQPIRRILLMLQRGPEQEKALKQLMDEQQSSSSPNYHHWLTPQQFGQQFGPADADLQAVTDWLNSHGFQIAKISNGRTLIEFSGNAGQVRRAFHTEIHQFSVNGALHFANNGDPQIPAALSPVVAGVASLNNFPKKSLTHTVGTFRRSKETGQVAPLFTFGGANTSCATATCNAVGPGDFANIYNVEKLWNPGISGHAIDGSGQTIAIVGDSEICTKNSPDFGASYIGPSGATATCSVDDVAQFRAMFGLPPNDPNVILDGPDPGFNGDEIEGDLDVEWAGAIAKNATINFVIAQGTEATFGTDLAAEYVVDNDLAGVLNESFGACEANLGASGNQFQSALWEQAAAQGITVIVSTGDGGAAGCDNPFTETAAGQNGVNFGPGVNGIASTPFNVAVGGTDFDVTAANYQATYWGGGNITDSNNIKDVSALTYIPETAWNSTCAQNFTGILTGCISLNGAGILAGGGGQSNCVATDNQGFCSTYYAKPSWQTVAAGSGLTVANDVTRDVPDISLFAGVNSASNSFYVVCESDLNFNGVACDLNSPFFDFTGVGGTSAAAPAFAGIMALVNQNIALNHPTFSPRRGNANYVLYNLAASQTGNCSSSAGPISTCTFNDVTKGNNSVPCVGGTFSCSSTSPANFGVLEAMDFNTGVLTGQPSWSAATGLDLATGLGSVNALNLVTNWATAEGAFTATTPTFCLSKISTALFSCPGPFTITHGDTVLVNIAVNGTVSGTPIPVSALSSAVTGTTTKAEDVSLVGTFPSGNPSCTVPGCGNTGGIDRFTSNNYLVVNVDFYSLVNGTVTAAPTNGLVGGTYNVVAHYAGDGTFGASDSSPVSVTVNPEASTTLLGANIINFINGTSTSAVSAFYGDTILVRADIIGVSSGQESATGTVTVTDTINSVPTQHILPLNTEGYTELQTGSTISGATTPPLAVGSHSFTANFSGDASYNASNLSAAVSLTVLRAPTTISLSASSMTVPANTTVTFSATVDTQSNSALSSGGSSGAAPTGTVSFFSNGAPIGTANLVATTDSSGFVAAQATFQTTFAATGNITATYVGDVNYAAPSASNSVTITVGSGINIAPAPGTTSISIPTPGQSATQLITVTGSSFTGTVALSCSVTAQPASAVNLPTCSFGTPGQNFTAPKTITLSGSATSGNATMTVASTATHALVLPQVPLSHAFRTGGPLFAFALSLVCLFVLIGWPKQRRWGLVPLALLLVALISAAAGCGGGSNSGGSTANPGTTTGAYTITVTATPSTGTAQTTTITVNVQ
jgi:hypothetical protein